MELPSAEQANSMVNYAQTQAAKVEFEAITAQIVKAINQNKLSVWYGAICSGNVAKLRGKGYKVRYHSDVRNADENQISWG